MCTAQAAFLDQPNVFFTLVCLGLFFFLNYMPSRKSPRSLSDLVNLSQKLSRGLETT